MRNRLLLLFVSCLSLFIHAQDVYPTNWFTGIKDPHLQLMIHQENISRKIPMYKLSATGMKLADGITLKLIRRVTNPNYVFLDLVIDKNAKPGPRVFSFGPPNSAVKINYELKPRHSGNGKTRTQGVTAKDFIYLLIPDRFSNGDPINDVVKGYRDETVDRENKFRRHGGDFKGVEDHFDYLDKLGVTTIWMTPVVENNTGLMHEFGNDVAGYHGYWFTDHYQVDKRLGGNDGYLSFCDAAHKKGFKVIQDAVYNHVSRQHWFVLDPPADDWLNNWPVFTGPNHREEAIFDPYASAYDKRVMLDGWFVDHLPDLNQRNPLVAAFLIQHAIWTTETYGIDGWRVDTYKYCDEEFLNKVNTALYTEFPGITVFGEAATSSVVGNAYFTQNNLNTTFKHNAKGVLDFQVSNAMLAGMSLSQGWTEGVNRLYMTLAEDIVYKRPQDNCIFLDNHDMDRVYSVVKEDWNKLKMGINWLLTLRGIPQLYYGTEILMKNTKQPTDALVREDFPGGWKEDATNKFLEDSRSVKEKESYTYISALARFRKASSALTSGKTTQFIPKDGLYVYFRYDDKQTIMVIANTGDKPVKPDWTIYAERTNGFTRIKDVVSGEEMPIGELEMRVGESRVVEMVK
jgi:neopullulanase